MSREVPEWIGKTDDQPAPLRVRVRVFDRAAGICGECGLKIFGKRWICDHAKAIINGGENREGNLQPIHEACDRKVKTPRDVAEKSKNYRVRARHIGAQKKSRFPGARSGRIKMKIGGGWEYR
jgi:5-methylcytosine-specific restriction endonuclease McrA